MTILMFKCKILIPFRSPTVFASNKMIALISNASLAFVYVTSFRIGRKRPRVTVGMHRTIVTTLVLIGHSSLVKLAIGCPRLVGNDCWKNQ